MAPARALHSDTPLDVGLADTIYALASSTIDLCLSLFPWANFRATKAAVKLHTLLDLRGSIPSPCPDNPFTLVPIMFQLTDTAEIVRVRRNR